MSGHTMEDTSDDGSFDYNPDQLIRSSAFNPAQAIDTAHAFLNLVSNRTVMSSLETVLRESYKFIRLADDLHDIKYYLNDIRLCFVALTVSGYAGLVLYGLLLCLGRRRRGRRRQNDGARSTTTNYGPAPPALGNNGANKLQQHADEEMSYGWKATDDSSAFKQNPTNKTSAACDGQGRYGTRSLNRNFQSNYHNAKLDSVDSPSKKHLLDNHHQHHQLGGSLGADATGGGNSPPGAMGPSPPQQQQQLSAQASRENGHRM